MSRESSHSRQSLLPRRRPRPQWQFALARRGVTTCQADVAPAEAAPMRASPGHNSTAGLRNYAELGGKLPELRLDLQVYAAKSADRYAFINMHKIREGEVTSEGVEVKEITPDGVVLEYQGTEFLLGRQ